MSLRRSSSHNTTESNFLGTDPWVQENLAGNREVRGIIVANEFTESLKYAAIAMPHVALKKYEVRFEFTEV